MGNIAVPVNRSYLSVSAQVAMAEERTFRLVGLPKASR